MINLDALGQTLETLRLESWASPLRSLTSERLSPRGHGDFAAWAEILTCLPAAKDDAAALKALLLGLAPWRKGPFDVSGVIVDSEWRSDLKWARIEMAVAPLQGRNVLDVGSGNGYYALQMKGAGANSVIGIDPTVLYVMQFLAVTACRPQADVYVLPARLEELPLAAKHFDTTFSMGVLYHQRSPIDHVRQLRQTLRAGGQLVLETLFIPGENAYARTPPERYARMRNVWLLPTLSELQTWLLRCGYKDVNVHDQSVTTTDEQRSTEWMTFESLADALDPNDPTRTIEGWPAPRRALITATSP